MLPTVVLLLSVFSVLGTGCDDLKRAEVSNLQDTIQNEEQKGFRCVFPNNYYVQHHFNGSADCEDSCCVSSAAFLLSDSWRQLLQHIDAIHFKYQFICELIERLEDIWKEGFSEKTLLINSSVFPLVHSSPRTLLTLTSVVFSKWLTLNCHDNKLSCPSPAPPLADKKEEQKDEHSLTDGKPDEEPKKEGEREKIILTEIPSNGNMGLLAGPTFFLCVFCCLRILLDVMMNYERCEII